MSAAQIAERWTPASAGVTIKWQCDYRQSYSRLGSLDLLHHVEHGAAAGHAVLPDPIEILD
jgi:hypothetical protein